tara:strand:- start:2608 stop:2796 length:189 start_codon:yes stop_codon:yes gene_type:complete
MTWRPIETAPMDGRLFFAWRKHTAFPLMVRYCDEYGEFEDFHYGHFIYSLTHWMPMMDGPDA